MKCPHCNQEHPEGFLFCPTTGQKINAFKACTNSSCPEKGKYILPIDSMYCPFCGSKLEGFDESQNGNERVFNVNGVSFKMIKIESGTFDLGDNNQNDNLPHKRTLLRDFFILSTPVTQQLYEAVMGHNPSCFQGDNWPVESVSWVNCQEFIRKLNRKTGKLFRLPDEDEWEIAARGGKNSKGYKYSGSDNLDEVAWSRDNAKGRLHPVSEKMPNELGLHDMSGNVWEWCNNWYYPNTIRVYGTERALRGGSWKGRKSSCEVTCRYFFDPKSNDEDIGFRIVLEYV